MAVMIGAALVAQASVGNAAPCRATVSIEAPPDVTLQVTRALRAHGVAVETTESCVGQRAVKARLTPVRSAHGFRLRIEDAFGRVSDRVVSEPAIAVSLIESWAVDEDADLLTAAPPQATMIESTTGSAETSQLGSRYHAWGEAIGALGNDGSIWAGAELSGCAPAGRACFGLQLRALEDTGTVGPTSDGHATRTTVDAFLIGTLPLTFGRVMIIPSLGAGAGWLRTNVPAEGDGDPALVSTVSFRAQAGVTTGFAFSRQVALALDLGVTVSPGARAESGVDQGGRTNIPAEPKTYLHAGLACVFSP